MRLSSRYIIILLIAIGIISVSVGAFVLHTSSEENHNITTAPKVTSVLGEKTSAVEDSQIYQYAAPWDKAMFDNFYAQTKAIPVGTPIVSGGIVPHHLLAGFIPATFFNALARQNPSVVVIVSPNHFHRGTGEIVTTMRDWQTPYGIVKTDREIISNLREKQSIEVNEDVIKEEHGIYGLVSFVKKSLPDTKLITLSLQNDAASGTLDALVNNLQRVLPRDAVIVASIDFSHYQNVTAANFHDELSMNVIKNFDFARLNELEIDSVPSLYVVLKSMEAIGAEHIAYELHTNAGDMANNPAATNITSYYSPYFTDGTREHDSAVSILHFGDIMIDRNVKKQIDVFGKDYLLGKLSGEEGRFFDGMDIVTANLEGPFANKRRPTSKSIAFRFDPILIPMLQKYHFSLFTLANNHSLDMGADGFRESKTNLQKAGISFYGSQYAVDDNSYIVKQVGDKKVAFVGVNDTNAPIDLDMTKKLIARGEKEANMTIVDIHWGVEYRDISAPRQRDLAHAFIDAGADVVIGNHPHVVEEMEVYKDRPIFYSLGNFIFDQYFSEPTQQGLGVGLVFHPTEISAYIFPLQGNKSQVTQMTGNAANIFMKSFVDRSRLGAYTINNFHISIPISTYGK